MDLTELQAELRLMEQHLAALQKEVEKMKPRSEEESKKKLRCDYETGTTASIET